MANPFTDPFNNYGYSLFSTPSQGGAGGGNNSSGFNNADPTGGYNAAQSILSGNPSLNVNPTPIPTDANTPRNITNLPGPMPAAAPPAQPVNAWGAANTNWQTQNSAAQGTNPGTYQNLPNPNGFTATPAAALNLAGISPTINLGGMTVANPAYLTALSNAGATATPNTPAAAATPSTLPGTSYPGATPFGTSPFMSNPTANNPNGSISPTTSYNPVYFPTLQTAQTVANMLGGTVGTGSMLSQGGGGFTQNQPNYTVTLKNGAVINPGFIAQYYQQYGDNPQMLARMINSEANSQPDASGNNFAPFAFNPAKQAATPADQMVQQALSGQTGTGSFLPGVGPGAPTPAAPSTTTGNGSNLDINSILSFLQAYSGLGNGAGTPTGINPAGQLGTSTDLTSLLAALLSGSLNGSLYSRQRAYPTTP